MPYTIKIEWKKKDRMGKGINDAKDIKIERNGVFYFRFLRTLKKGDAPKHHP